MKIQLALDRLSREECYRLAEQTRQSIDWLEVGTGVIKEYGMQIVRELHQNFPELSIVADMKTSDAGKHEAEQAFQAGAHVVTAMAFADNRTLTDMLHVAHNYHGQIMVDLLGITDPSRIIEIRNLGLTWFCLHKGKDMQQNNQLVTSSTLELIKGIEGIHVAIAGGITLESATELSQMDSLDVLIIGSSITGSPEPKLASEAFRKILARD